MPIVIPPGFIQLLGKVRGYWGYSHPLPASADKMFGDLVYWTVLSGITNSAQNEYLHGLTEGFTKYRNVRDTWSLKAKKALTDEGKRLAKQLLSRPSARAATSLKLDAIGKLLERRIDVNNSLLEAQQVIPKLWKDEGGLTPWRNSPKIINLVTEIAHPNGKYKIFDVGYVKATKWLQSCGVGQQVVAPMAQVAKFLAEFCACSEFRRPDYEYKRLGGLDEVEMPQVLVDWSPMNARCKELAGKTSKRWATAEIVGDAIHVVMYVRGLVRFVGDNHAASRKVTPASLFGFLDQFRISFDRFMDDVYDIDKVPGLIDRLESHLS